MPAHGPPDDGCVDRCAPPAIPPAQLEMEVRMERTQGLRRAAASLTGAVVLSLALAGGALASPSASGAGASLAEIRQATAMYLDVGSAIADGYVPVSPCVEAPGVGAMGFHYLKPGLAADLAVDARTPEILVYAP